MRDIRRPHRLLVVVVAAVLMGATLGGEIVRALAPTPTAFELAAAPMAEPARGMGQDVLLPRGMVMCSHMGLHRWP